MKRIMVATLILATSACGSMVKPAAPMVSAFDASEIAWAKEPGRNTLRASALLRQNGGGVVTCAGKNMDLIPASSYSRERMSRIYGSTSRGFWQPLMFDFNPRVPAPEPAYLQAHVSRVCDPQGFVTFSNLADGEYFVTTEVTWSTGTNYSYEGGLLMQHVQVEGGETKEIVLTN